MSGAPRLLQFTVDWSQFLRGRLNPEVPYDEAGDCGANTLVLLRRISDELAMDLSDAQNYCRRHYTPQTSRVVSVYYLFTHYLFTNIEKKYEAFVYKSPEELIVAANELKPGNGTVLYMRGRGGGHYVCIQKDIHDRLSIIDLQSQNVIYEVEGYLRRYDEFVMPTIILKRGYEEMETGEKPKKRKGGTRRRTRRNRRKN